MLNLIFFFSSRRRHTRCSRDWSSDVCSSDLRDPGGPNSKGPLRFCPPEPRISPSRAVSRSQSLDYPGGLSPPVPRETRPDHVLDGRRVQTVLSTVHARTLGLPPRPDRCGSTDPRVPPAAGATPRDQFSDGAGGCDPQANLGASVGIAVDPLPSPEENAGGGNHRPRGIEGTRVSR